MFKQTMIALTGAATIGVGFAESVEAATIVWTDWTSANTTTATGSMGGIGVDFTGVLDPTAQTDGGGINYWAVNSEIYTAPLSADNPPPDSDIIRLKGGTNAGTQTLQFSEAVTNPVMAIMSLGRTNLQVTYDFDVPFTILNQGKGYWGGTDTSLVQASGDQLLGNEGHGLIQFQGTFTEINWTIPDDENWHGFTVGVTEPVPEPASMLGLLAFGAIAASGALKKKSAT